MIIRDADPRRDAAACAGIYGPYVSGSVVSFEALSPTVEEMSSRISTYRRIGWKAGAWHDVQWWQLDLHPGEPGPPDELTLA